MDDKKKGKLLVRGVTYVAAASLDEYSGRIDEAEWRRLTNFPIKRSGRENQFGCVMALKNTWLKLAEENRLAGNLPRARQILLDACASVPESEELWIAAFDLEMDNHEPETAKAILALAREEGKCVTQRVWLKSAVVERELGDTDGEREVLCDGLRRFPLFFKLWLMLGQLEERIGDLHQAKTVYKSGLNRCLKCVPLWVSFADVVEKTDGFSEGRSVLAASVKRNPKIPELWLAAIRAEIRHGNKEEADMLMAKALEECPTSEILWAASIEMAPRPEREDKIKEAYNKCNKRPHVLAAVAKVFWEDGKVEKVRKRLAKAVTIAPYIGDFWALYYKFELEHGTDERHKYVLKRCVAEGPKHGEKWQMVSKAVENSHQPTEAILKKVVPALGK